MQRFAPNLSLNELSEEGREEDEDEICANCYHLHMFLALERDLEKRKEK